MKLTYINKRWRHVAVVAVMAMNSQLSLAGAFGFDRPGEGLGTAIVPQARLAWEQSLPTANYIESDDHGIKQSTLTLQSDVLARIGVGADTELRIGWDGAVWQRQKQGTLTQDSDGIGDVTLGLKRAINTHDEQFSWALLAQVNLANGDDEFSVEKKIYTLGSAIDYQYSDDLNTTMTLYYEMQDGAFAWSAIPGLQYKISERWSGFSEYVYHKQESQRSESTVNNGVIWTITDNLQMDAAIGYTFSSAQPQVNAGFGVAYLF
ncbi:MAG: transporter [Acinetobacter sp.]|jgi:hypothetical protein|nr:MAG: transporter [Acinetobacter sp.]